MTLRPATPTDAGGVGAILSEFTDSTDWMPRLHSRAEDVAHAGAMIARGWVTVVEEGCAVQGFAACDGDEVNALYVARDARGRGLGSRLLDDLKTRRRRLELWTFQANTSALAFYKRHGFAEDRRTDGTDNDEGLPDVHLHWQRKEY